ncbi:hypothetical protein [Polymorphobacter multimanifer]|uniref:hypothetical protein n=1 Tax=Polymorphobacter multimanifer TaxID=1070431 RepID=UPI001FB05568|nr:hypothetical protein [Polymorphobacter multimanifer]
MVFTASRRASTMASCCIRFIENAIDAASNAPKISEKSNGTTRANSAATDPHASSTVLLQVFFTHFANHQGKRHKKRPNFLALNSTA